MPKRIANQDDNIPWENDTYQICSDLWKRHVHTTPDYRELKLQNEIPVFVYGSLKSGGFLHDILKGCPFLGAGQTHQEKFYMKETGSFPCVFEITHGVKGMQAIKGKIQGELYVVDPLRMLELDRMENNGSMYTRRQLYIKALDQGTHLLRPSVKAWMYIASDTYWGTTKLHDIKAKVTGNGQVYEWPVEGPVTHTVQQRKALLI